MHQSVQFNETTYQSVNNSLNRSFRRRELVVIELVLALACFALSPTAGAALPPPAPDGGYPNGNTAEGENALFSLTSGFANTAIGSNALNSNTSGKFNTAVGGLALASNTTGTYNVANGFDALNANTTGTSNTANGGSALFYNTTGSYNTANGSSALTFNTIGSSNTANGYSALYANTNGHDNTADGVIALLNNTIGSYNTADGRGALYSNTSGGLNTATGATALLHNRSGNLNTAEGRSALYNNTTGGNNTALGASAGFNLTTGSNNIEIGNVGVAAESNTIRIGTQGTQTATYVAGIRGATAAAGVAVFVAANGRLGTVTSSQRFKEQIRPMDKASEILLALKPVTFRYKHALDPEGIRQFGLVAEEVEKVNPDLVARDEEGKPYTVRYEAVNAMLLNEFLKEHRKVEELEKDLRTTIAQQQKQIEALTNKMKERNSL